MTRRIWTGSAWVADITGLGVVIERVEAIQLSDQDAHDGAHSETFHDLSQALHYLRLALGRSLGAFARQQRVIEEPCWRCGGSGQRSAHETLGSPGNHPCPVCQD